MSPLRVIVTGGSRGIGRACALRFASAGARVGVCARNESDLERLENESAGLTGSVEFEVADALDLDSMDAAVRRLDSRLGGTDVLINNVGGGGRWGETSVLATRPSTWHEVMTKNFFATVSASSAVLHGMCDRKFGRIIVIASRVGREADGRPWFVSAKAAQIAYVRSMARREEFSLNQVAFICIAPGATYTETSGWATMSQSDPEIFANFEKSLPLGRLITAQEVADTCFFVAGEAGLPLNGACIAVDGGEGVAI